MHLHRPSHGFLNLARNRGRPADSGKLAGLFQGPQRFLRGETGLVGFEFAFAVASAQLGAPPRPRGVRGPGGLGRSPRRRPRDSGLPSLPSSLPRGGASLVRHPPARRGFRGPDTALEPTTRGRSRLGREPSSETRPWRGAPAIWALPRPGGGGPLIGRARSRWSERRRWRRWRRARRPTHRTRRGGRPRRPRTRAAGVALALQTSSLAGN
mmetsp:Transcript_57738/g.130829  ORF Transcript_57738/g.130829 Transcript_57738/m.130829 type:complete len:211 (+) Transcript_57738:86-718(+)